MVFFSGKISPISYILNFFEKRYQPNWLKINLFFYIYMIKLIIFTHKKINSNFYILIEDSLTYLIYDVFKPNSFLEYYT